MCQRNSRHLRRSLNANRGLPSFESLKRSGGSENRPTSSCTAPEKRWRAGETASSQRMSRTVVSRIAAPDQGRPRQVPVSWVALTTVFAFSETGREPNTDGHGVLRVRKSIRRGPRIVPGQFQKPSCQPGPPKRCYGGSRVIGRRGALSRDGLLRSICRECNP